MSSVDRRARCADRAGDSRGRGDHSGNTFDHSDAGSQHTALRFGETLFLQGLLPSIGSVADAFDCLTGADVDALCVEFDAIRRDIEASRGERDARYIRTAIRLQRFLEIGVRAVLFASWFPPAWVAGAALLGTAKIRSRVLPQLHRRTSVVGDRRSGTATGD